VRDTAAELLALYAKRAARDQGHAFRLQAHDYEAFADGFGFEETPDQARPPSTPSSRTWPRASRWTGWSAATSASARPRSRCAPPSSRSPTASRWRCWPDDAARRAALPDLLRPLRRLAGEARRAVALRTAKEAAAALKALAEGTVDIVIGTHKLLSRDVKFAPGAGHHRRGAPLRRAPEGALKALRAEVDVLTLTATPIPRTLGLSLEGLREFSVIATAPQKRLAIKTFVAEGRGPDPRGGAARAQARRAGVLPAQRGRHHREPMRERLRELLPEARIAVGHGQMPSASSSA
jgi:transcription-repair coupling factor (superfamily II helicase)